MVICPSGAFSILLSSPLCKNISLHPSGKSSLQIRAIPPHQRGVSRSSRTRGADAVDAAAFCVRRDCRAGRKICERSPARGRETMLRTAKSCLPGADKTLIRRRRWQKSPVTEESAKETVKTIACGNAGRFRCTRCYSCASTNTKCTRGRGCNGHPAFPTPSFGAKDSCKARARSVARSRSCR
jgi:hypothetical protein